MASPNQGRYTQELLRGFTYSTPLEADLLAALGGAWQQATGLAGGLWDALLRRLQPSSPARLAPPASGSQLSSPLAAQRWRALQEAFANRSARDLAILRRLGLL